jgi:sugar lactone lactonase YvrE
VRILLALAALAAVLATAGPPAGAGGTQLRLPFDLESRGRVVYVSDGLRHQILRLDLRTGRVGVVAGTGRAGHSGDGGPAVRATIGEVVGLAIDAGGNLYAADFPQGRVRRISARGTITTVARVPEATAVAVDPTGPRLAISSIRGPVHVLDLRTGELTKLTDANEPHGVAYERDGDLLVADRSALRRFAGDGTSTVVLDGNVSKVQVAPNGAIYAFRGDHRGGTIDRVVDGKAVRVAGAGGLTPYRASQPARSAGILPTDLEVLADGTILLAQSEPVPAVRRLANGRLTTILR